jgi:hypothetical protein
MDVLVLESEPGAADAAIEALEAADHRVLRCHERGARAFPCRGLVPGSCPLERDAVQVVLTVRGHTFPRPSPLEDGVTCALRRRLPVVMTGSTALNPFAGFRVVDAARRDVVAACEDAATGPQVDHEAVATRVLDETLRRAGTEAGGNCEVRRRGDGIDVRLTVPPGTDARTRAMAGVRVVGALRAFDSHTPRIDVGFAPAAADAAVG